MSINNILKSIQKTNPEMTKKKLLKELSMYNYSTAALIITFDFEKGSK